MITVRINNEVIPNVKQGMPLTTRLDEELDSGVLIIPFSNRKERYNMFDDVSINKDGVTFDFSISSDDVKIMSKNPEVYQHTVLLIESTKKLERVTGASITFTQPTDGSIRYTMQDVVTRIQKLFPFETVENQYGTRKFDIDYDLYNFLNQIKAPQFFLNRPTCLGAINQAFKYINAIARIRSHTILDADFYNDLKELISLDGAFDYSQSQNIDLYATKLESYIDNQISDTSEQGVLTYPSDNLGFASVRSDELRLTSSNMIFPVPYPIYKLIRLDIFLTIVYGTDDAEMTIKKDLTEFIYEKKAWNSLVANSELGSPSKRNSLKYDYMGRSIYGLGDKYDVLFGSKTVIQSICEEIVYEATGIAYPASPKSYQDIMYQVTYVPMFNNRIQVERNNLQEVNMESALFTNQQERIIDIDSFANNLYGQVNRLANGDIEIPKLVKTLDQAFEVGQYTADGYIITLVQNNLYNDFIMSKAVATKDFNRISEYIGVNSEIRQYEIPGDGFTLERHEHYNEYVIISGSQDAHDSYVTQLGRDAFVNTFNNINLSERYIQVCVFKPKNLLLSVNSIGAGNSLIFTFGFDDNVNAGNKIIQEGTDWINQYVKYTEEDGTLDTFSFDLAQEFELASDPSIAKNLPEVDPLNVKDVMVSTPDFKLMKDPAEVFKMTYQLHIVPELGYEDTFIIGRYLASHNKLVMDPNRISNNIYVWLSDEKYCKFDNKICKGVKTDLVFSVYVDPLYCRVSATDIPADQSAWALGDANGNLYLAVNDDLQHVYFNFKNKRE